MKAPELVWQDIKTILDIAEKVWEEEDLLGMKEKNNYQKEFEEILKRFKEYKNTKNRKINRYGKKIH